MRRSFTSCARVSPQTPPAGGLLARNHCRTALQFPTTTAVIVGAKATAGLDNLVRRNTLSIAEDT
jgi:hypothetical protein